jgi:hypothetical protein
MPILAEYLTCPESLYNHAVASNTHMTQHRCCHFLVTHALQTIILQPHQFMKINIWHSVLRLPSGLLRRNPTSRPTNAAVVASASTLQQSCTPKRKKHPKHNSVAATALCVACGFSSARHHHLPQSSSEVCFCSAGELAEWCTARCGCAGAAGLAPHSSHPAGKTANTIGKTVVIVYIGDQVTEASLLESW